MWLPLVVLSEKHSSMTSEVESKRWLVGEMTKNVWKSLKTIIKKRRLYNKEFLPLQGCPVES